MPNKKTTLMIDEGLYTQVRQRALEDGVSASSIVAEAIRRYVTTPKHNPFLNLPRGAGEWKGPDLTKVSNAELFAMMDEGLPLEKLR